MTASRKVVNIRGFDVRVFTQHSVSRVLTEEVDDMVIEAIDDFLKQGVTIPKLVDNQQSLVEVLRYYLQDVCLPEVSYYFSVTGDGRNNPIDNVGINFILEIEFQAKNSIIPTRIRYTIEY